MLETQLRKSLGRQMSLQSVAVCPDDTTRQDLNQPSDTTINSLWHYFPQYFQVILAKSCTQKKAIYQLRHKVYCEELQFEPARIDRLEQDNFDNRAIHACIRPVVSDQLAGTVRIITSAFKNELLPMEQYFSDQITNTVLAPQNFSRQHICEISRLAVPAEIRCRPSGARGTSSPLESACSKLVAISLYLISQILCLRSGKIHAYVMVEPALARALRRVGIHFVQIGEPVELNGIRAPYYLDVRTTNNTLKPEYRKLRNVLEEQLFGAKVRPQVELCYSAS